MKVKSFFQLHISVLLFGFTAVLGDIIQLPTISLVWWRVFISVVFFTMIVNPLKLKAAISQKYLLRHIFIGVLVALHWLTFYGSIKISSASIVLIAMSSTSFFTAVVEPIIIKASKFRLVDLIFSLLIIPAMVLIYYNANEVQKTGLWIGFVSALVGAVFSVLNKKWLVDGKEKELMYVQHGSILISMVILLAVLSFTGPTRLEIPVGIDWFYLIVFAIACTIVPYILYLKAMKWLSAFEVSFAFNMEPVYGMIMAAILLKDHLEISPKIYLGMFFILILVSIHTSLKSLKRRKPEIR